MRHFVQCGSNLARHGKRRAKHAVSCAKERGRKQYRAVFAPADGTSVAPIMTNLNAFSLANLIIDWSCSNAASVPPPSWRNRMQQLISSPEQSGSSQHSLSLFNDSHTYSQPPAERMPYRQHADDKQLAKALGWFSIGLGLVQLLAPRAVSRATCVNDHPVLVRAIGMREIASGVGILNERKPTEWLWSRVAGDAMALALLGMAAGTHGPRRDRVAMVTAAEAGGTALG